MSKFLTEEWLIDVREAVNGDAALRDAVQSVDFAMAQSTTDIPERGEVGYWFAFKDGEMDNGFGDPPFPPDATLTMKHETAAKLYSGQLNMQLAVMKGQIKIKGNMAKLLQTQKALNGLMPIVGSVTTEY